jgi:GntR family transcriptional regulator
MRLGPISAAGPGALYQQIVEAIKREVASGRLAAGTALPSFRVLAQELLVSLITVKRAYEELERAGIIFRRQGLGTFVADRGHDRTRAAQRVRAREAICAAVRAGREAGMSNRELQQLLRQELNQSPTHDEQAREAG